MPKQSAADAFVQLYARDIRENPDAYKRGVVADPEGTARRIIEGLGDADARRLLADLKAERRKLGSN